MGVSFTFIEPAMRSVLDSHGLSDYQDFIDCRMGEPVTAVEPSQTRRLTLDDGGRRSHYYLKVYRYAARRGRLRARKDKAEQEARNYRYLRDVCRVHVPDVICYGSRSQLWWRRDSFILTRGVSGAEPLDEFVKNRWPRAVDGLNSRERKELLGASCELVRAMHAQHFYHLDLQWRNILVQPPCHLFVIDSSKGRPHWAPLYRSHGRLRDISSMTKESLSRLTRSERIRWLRNYLGRKRLQKLDRMMIRAIEQDRILKDNTPR